MSKHQSRSHVHRRSGRNKNRSSQVLTLIITAVLGLLLVAAIGVAGVSVYWIAGAPEINEEALKGSHGSTLVDQNGEAFYTLGGTEREEISYEEVGPVLEAAVLSIEDHRFYGHRGVDFIRLAGAVVANFRDGFGSQGGSTITQQLVKLSVFSTSSEDQTLKRKVQEAWLALKVEREYSKEEILTMYINKVYMSDNIYGMGTASEYYFDKPATELQIDEAAMLAGMPQSPNNYNPYLETEKAEERRDVVIQQMEEVGYIDEEQADQAAAVPLEESLAPRNFKDGPNLVIDSYVHQVLKEVREKTDIDPYMAGATIHTNMDPGTQQHVFDVLNSDNYIAYPDEDYQAAVTIVDVETGQVKSVGGGRNIEDAMGYNRATELDRSIGSTMKPLSVYGPAIEYEQYSTHHQVVDGPYQFPSGETLENVDNSYRGQISMRESLVQSRNITTAKLFEKVGLERGEEFLAQIGIEGLNDGDGLYWSNAIGGEVTPYQLAASYAAFGNEGKYTEPYTVSKITLVTGEEIDLTPETVQAMSDYTAYMVTDMLKDAALTYSQLGTLNSSGLPHAGKTGTTNYASDIKLKHGIPSAAFPDRWYAGYTKDYSIAVWTGYDYQLEPGNWMTYGETSGWNALYIYQALMSYLIENGQQSYEDWVMPDSVVPYNVVRGSNPPREGYGPTELFVKGNEPGNYSTDDLARRSTGSSPATPRRTRPIESSALDEEEETDDDERDDDEEENETEDSEESAVESEDPAENNSSSDSNPSSGRDSAPSGSTPEVPDTPAAPPANNAGPPANNEPETTD